MEILFAVGLQLATLYALRGDYISRSSGISIAAFDANALRMGIAAVVGAGYFYGPLYGAAVIVAFMIHEMGRVLAFRVCGNSDAWFRLIPMFGDVAISNQRPASHQT